jgi:hypothetical protein
LNDLTPCLVKYVLDLQLGTIHLRRGYPRYLICIYAKQAANLRKKLRRRSGRANLPAIDGLTGYTKGYG